MVLCPFAELLPTTSKLMPSVWCWVYCGVPGIPVLAASVQGYLVAVEQICVTSAAERAGISKLSHEAALHTWQTAELRV
jgi:hypothetical protein